MMILTVTMMVLKKLKPSEKNWEKDLERQIREMIGFS